MAAKPFELDKYPSKMIAGLPDHVHNAARIRYPMVRVDWLRKRHLSDTSQRGDNRFVRVSWDEASTCSMKNRNAYRNSRAECLADRQWLAIDGDVP